MLNPGPDEAGRDALAQDVKSRIEAKGTLKQENKWGLRKLAYEIEKSNEADYRWYRFEGPSDLLDELNHNLKIADGVLRFRIFKVDPETPAVAPPATAAPAPGAGRERDSGPSRPSVSTREEDSEAAEAAPEESPAPAE